MTEIQLKPLSTWRVSPKQLAIAALVLAIAGGLIVSGQFLVLAGLVLGTAVAVAVFLYPLAGLLALILTSTCFQVLTSSTLTGLPLSLGRLFGILTTAAFLATAVNRRLALSYAPQMRALALFLGAIAVSVLLMPDTEQSLLGVLKMGQAVMLYFLVANIGAQHVALRWVCASIVALATCASIIAIIEHYVPSFQVNWNDPRLREPTLAGIVDDESIESGEITRVSGGVGDANYFSYTVAACLPMALYWWRTKRNGFVRTLILACVAIQCAGMIFSYTRTGFMGLTLATIYLVYRRRLPLGPLIFLGSIGAVVAIYLMVPQFKERFFTWRYYQEGSTPQRRDLYWAGLQMFRDHPILGYGYGQFGPEFMHRMRADRNLQIGDSAPFLQGMVEKGYEDENDLRCHNTYLEVAIEYGLLGLIPFLWFLWRILRDLDPVHKYGGIEHADLAVCLTASFICFFACGMLAHAKLLNILWILAGLSVALRRLALRNLSEPEAQPA